MKYRGTARASIRQSFARSQALLGNVVLQAGACLFGVQSGDWELAQIYLSLKSNHRVAYGIAFALFSLFCLWFVGMQFEVWGIQACF